MSQPTLPCPFCGSTNIYFGHEKHSIQCMSCTVQTPVFETPEQAKSFWNNRAKTEKETTTPDDSKILNWIERNARVDPKMDGNHVYWPTAFNKTIRGRSLRDAVRNAMSNEVADS